MDFQNMGAQRVAVITDKNLVCKSWSNSPHIRFIVVLFYFAENGLI